MKVKQNPIASAIKKALYSGLIASVALSSVTHAQEDTTDVEKLENTVVTGTNIRGVDLEGALPVTIIDRTELLASGITDVGDLLQRLPAFSGSPLGTRTNNGGNGGVFVDLRGIGSGRTLVLIDGKRTVDGGDFQSIPSAMIERVEILNQGASAIYGADAVAGVVNIITRSNFNGAEFEFSISDSFDTDSNDVKQASFVFGNQSDTGGYVFGIQYEDQSATLQGDTPYDFLQDSFGIIDPEAFTGFDPNSDAINRVGSSRIPCGNFNIASAPGVSFTVDGNNPGAGECGAPGRPLTIADFREFNGGFFDPNNDTYNFAPINFLQTPFEKTNIFFNGHKEINGVEIFTNFRYNHRTSSQQLAPIPYDSNFDPAAPLAGGGNGISADNVFNPFGEDVTRVRRRMTETDRIFTQDIQQYQALIGAKGSISDSGWTWDASYNFGFRERVDQDFGQFIGSKLSAALGPSFFDVNGVATCGTSEAPIAGCVPLNLFGGPGTVTPEMIEFISATLQDVNQSQLDVFNANASGILFDLPAGPVGAAFGIEYRDQGVSFIPDSSRVIGEATGGQVSPTAGTYDVKSLYTEFSVPLMDSDLGVLDANLGIRYDDYSTVGANTTFQGGITYRPTDSLLIRASYAEVFREPGVFALFSGVNNGFPPADDPCNDNNFAGLTSGQQSVCQAQGVPPGGWRQTDTQLRQLTGGNPNLEPEEGETTTIGLAWSPEFLNGFTTTIDWWKVDLDQGFAVLSVENTVLNCLNSGSASSLQCSLIDRRSDGSIISVSGQTLNATKIVVEGVDVGLAYAFGTDFGQFNLGFNYTKLIDNQRQAFAGDDIEELAGRYTGQAYNDERAKVTAVWNYDNWTVNYSLDYFSDLTADLQFFDVEEGTQRIASQSYSDIAVSYAVPWYQSTVTVGVNNVFDKDPPFIDSGFSGGTEPATYRVFGRSWFVRWKTSF